MNENINIKGSVAATVSDFHATMCRNVPVKVALLANVILFGSVPSEASIDAVRARLADSEDVWIFPLLKQCTHTKTLMGERFADEEKSNPRAAYSSIAALFITEHGGVLGLAEYAEATVTALEQSVEAAIKAGKTVDENDLLFIKVPKHNASMDIKFDHGSVKGRFLEIRVDDNGKMTNLPDDLPDEIKSALESHVAALRASGAL